MWIALGADSTVARQIMEMMMEKLNVIVPYVDKKESILKPGMTKVATNQPLAVSEFSTQLAKTFYRIAVEGCVCSGLEKTLLLWCISKLHPCHCVCR